MLEITLNELRKIQHDPALINIGKNGLKDAILNNIVSLVEKRGAVKVRATQTVIDYRNVFDVISARTGLKVYKSIGRTAVFYREK